ncbi:ABC transporter permease [Actinocorallia populi]|uniref:ABC transporter permease n=1 Tax=Actinocorallia populi TaxID=2079200 RepID=UPI000D089C4D|nr:ABC transporter permease [Actinocorallia populi]
MTSAAWVVADGWTLTRRALLHWVRQPAQVIVGLLFPVLIVVMFVYILGGGMQVPGEGGYEEFLLPGMFALTMVFGIEGTFTAVASDAAKGVTDRFRTLPMTPGAVLLGRSAADLLNSALGLLVMMGCGLAVGWRWHEGFGRVVVAVALLLWLRFAFLWLGIYLGVRFPSPEAVVVMQILVWPVGFLSNAFASPSGMPGWVAFLAEANPMSATVTVIRDLFGNPGAVDGSWTASYGVWPAVLWPAVITAVFLPLAVRRYQRLGG